MNHQKVLSKSIYCNLFDIKPFPSVCHALKSLNTQLCGDSFAQKKVAKKANFLARPFYHSNKPCCLRQHLTSFITSSPLGDLDKIVETSAVVNTRQCLRLKRQNGSTVSKYPPNSTAVSYYTEIFCVRAAICFK